MEEKLKLNAHKKVRKLNNYIVSSKTHIANLK